MCLNIKLTSYQASFDSDDGCEGDDPETDVTFIGEGTFNPCCFMWSRVHAQKMCILDVSIVLEVQMVDEYEWDEKAMLNIIVVEVDPENDEDEGAMNGSMTASARAAARTK